MTDDGGYQPKDRPDRLPRVRDAGPADQPRIRPEVIWEDPPPVGVRQRYGNWVHAFADQCLAYPGKWARVVRPDGRDEHGSSVRHNLLRRGMEVRGTAVRDDGSRCSAGETRLWARWPE